MGVCLTERVLHGKHWETMGEPLGSTWKHLLQLLRIDTGWQLQSPSRKPSTNFATDIPTDFRKLDDGIPMDFATDIATEIRRISPPRVLLQPFANRALGISAGGETHHLQCTFCVPHRTSHRWLANRYLHAHLLSPTCSPAPHTESTLNQQPNSDLHIHLTPETACGNMLMYILLD